jgi:hypothetical protein
MSLVSVIEEIAADMEHDAAPDHGGDALRSYAKQLRRAVKAAEGASPPPAPFILPETQHRNEIEKAKMEFRAKKTTAEESCPMSIVCEGGPHDETYVTVPTDMPDGAHTELTGSVYTRRGDRLVFDVVETAVLSAKRQGVA